jgi:hypothetical protein
MMKNGECSYIVENAPGRVSCRMVPVEAGDKK